MISLLAKTVGIGLLLILAEGAFAVGLGNVAGQAILGQPLRVEIPLLGSDDAVPAPDCFKLRPPTAEIDSAFVLREARIQIVGERGRAKLIVSTASPVREPVLEFGVTIGCGFEFSRDYLLLAAEPSRMVVPAEPTRPTVSPPAQIQDSPLAASKSPKAGLPASANDKLLRVERDVSLRELARRTYPLQPKAREKFMRMMLQANPAVRQDDNPITAGSELQLPPGLPIRRLTGRYEGLKSVAEADKPVRKPDVASPKSAKQLLAASARAPKDLLVLGAPSQRSATELLAEAERLTALLMEQNAAQSAAAEKITQLEDSLSALKKHVNGLETRTHAIEMERQAEKLAAKPASVDFVELLLAVLAGGAMGGLTLHFYNRLQLRRTPAPDDPPRESAVAANSKGLSGNSRRDGLPWEKADVPAATTTKADTPENARPAEENSRPAKPPRSPQNDFDFVSKQSP